MHNRNDALNRVVGPVNVAGSATSYFSKPESNLDPGLFVGEKIKPWVRNSLIRMLYGFLSTKYHTPYSWTTVWIAGSGVSYQWSAQRSPGDLDVLIGVNYEVFRKDHPDYMGLSDTEISKMLNDDFRTGLMPSTKNWEGYEVTFYVNPGATDIRVIKPYAAYDLTHDDWTVHPDPQAQATLTPAWEQAAKVDNEKAKDIVSRYSTLTASLQAAKNDAQRRNAEFLLLNLLEQANALYEDIHGSRKLAFSESGQGYSDFYNYRWQAGKRLGTVGVLSRLKDFYDDYKTAEEVTTYGVELPDVRTLIRRAAMYRANRNE
jgi:hypothetical protein